jgi:hypothetical protein
MNHNQLSKKFFQSYLYTDDGNFFISTAYRKSSAERNPDGWYYETFAWILNEETNEKTVFVADNSGAGSVQGALNQHFAVVEELGEFKSRS